MIARALLALTLGSALASAHGAEGSFDSNGVKIRYFTEGSGVPVILVHGWMSDSTMWGRDSAGNTKLDASPLPGFQVIALDCRGHGKSDKPHEAEKYGEEMANDVVRLMDHLKLPKTHLVGYSMGTFIVSNVAAKHPDRVLSLVYGGQAPLLTGASSMKSEEVEAFAKAVEEGKGLGAYLLAADPHRQPPLTLAQADAITKLMFVGKDVKALAAAGRSFPELAVSADALKKCRVPTLFLYGEKDGSKERILAVQKILGFGDVHEVARGDHITTLIKPDFGASLVRFLKTGKGLSL